MWPFDTNSQQIYEQYASAYNSGNYNHFEPHQVVSHLQQFMQSAPMDMQQHIYQQHFEQMPYEQRTLLSQQFPPEYGMDINNPLSMSQNFLRMGQEQPQLLQRIFNHPTMLAGTLALTGLVAKHMLESHPQGRYDGRYGAGYIQGAYQQEELLQRELNRERREERELRKELRQEERRLEEIEVNEPHRRYRRENY